jgi:mannosyltransferase OCH1-like enzyme
VIVQFWDDADAIPVDVQQCMNSWSCLESQGYKRLLFDDTSAAEFVKQYLGERHLRAFQKCAHAAMRSDYFSYAFIWVKGGV